MTAKVGRPKSGVRLAAEALGLTKKQVQSIGLDRLTSMKPEAQQFMINLAKSSRRSA
jgi:hypothetical protein